MTNVLQPRDARTPELRDPDPRRASPVPQAPTRSLRRSGRALALAVVVVAALVSVTGCARKKTLTYRQLVDAQQDTLKAYGKVPDAERVAALKQRLGPPHETAPDQGTTGRWYALNTPQDATQIDCHVLEVSYLDATKAPGMSVRTAEKSKCN